MEWRRTIVATALSMSLTWTAPTRGDGPPALESLREVLARVAGDNAATELRKRFLADARRDAAKPILRRPRSLEELFQGRLTLKYRVRPQHLSALPDDAWQAFSLSQGDAAAGSLLKNELPRLAAATVLTGDAALRQRTLAQLEGLAAWTPLERRGWSISNAKPRISGDDGAWLGTGWLVRAIVDALDILPPETVPRELRGALQTRLAAEVAAMDDDWSKRRPWYFRAEAAHSNQWILPNEALVRACLFLGVDKHRASYERGVSNLLRSLDSQGRDGEFVEGLRYAGLSLESLYSIAWATARAGDNRLRTHPFLNKFPTWLVHHFQPGGFLINAFDAPGSSRGNMSRDQALLATAAVAAGSPHALWALRTRAGFPATLDGILAARLPAAQACPPPLYRAYALATRLNWRSSWDDDTAAGLWLRGGHASDFHDHMDRGHVNFIIGQRPLLIEAGTLNYAVPDNTTHLRSVAGHNVLQIGDASPDKLTPDALAHAGQILTRKRRAAPLTVERMDDAGGAAAIDLSNCYEALERWQRHVRWTCREVTIDDDVEFKQPEIVQFRWHLGAPADAARTVGKGRIMAGDVRLNYTADQPLDGRVESMPDATLAHAAITQHACVVLRTAAPVLRLKLRTCVGLDDHGSGAKSR